MTVNTAFKSPMGERNLIGNYNKSLSGLSHNRMATLPDNKYPAMGISKAQESEEVAFRPSDYSNVSKGK